MVFSNDRRLRSEEIIFYLDLSTDYLKKKSLSKALKKFSEKTEEFKNNISYGVVIFKKGKELYSIYNKESSLVLDSIDNIWDDREKEQSFFENGLYEILAHIFKVSRKKSKVYRIIILTDSPSQLSEEYHTALYNLILKAKQFSTYIDIIRVGNRKFYSDDVKLKVISSETYGGVLYCTDKQLKNYLESISKSRENYNVFKPEPSEVLNGDLIFYEKLATDLISLSPEDKNICILCENELCPICEAYSDELHKCYNCNAPFHNCCAAEYSITNNIGFSHIFRCPQCGALLIMDKDFINLVLKEKREEEEDLVDEFEEEIADIEKKVPYPQDVSREPSKRKVKIGGYFGKEIVIEKNPTENQESMPNTRMQEESSEELSISITTLKPPKSKNRLRVCPICGSTIKDSINCPVCGSKVE